MGFIIKNTAGLINTRLTDIGREKLSQGNFNISYFQIGDSEVSYNTLPTTYNQFDTVILEPSFNAILSNSYNKYLASSVNDCETQALRNNSEFFLINDISSIGNTNYTNCYIPKSSSSGSSVIGDNSVIARALNLFNS